MKPGDDMNLDTPRNEYGPLPENDDTMRTAGASATGTGTDPEQNDPGYLLRSMPAIPEDPTFWPRLREHIEARKERGTVLFPDIPLRFRAAFSVAILALVLAGGAWAYWNRDTIAGYLSRKGEEVQLAYQETMGGEWIMPLFEKTDKDRVLQFAMYGTLPLDEQQSSVLRIEQDSSRAYRIELGKNDRAMSPRITVEDLYREVRATPTQQRIMDSVLLLAQQRLESVVLMGRERDVAIDPSVTHLHATILGTLASSLEPAQRIRLDRFLRTRDAAYSIEETAAVPPPPPAELYSRIRVEGQPQQFVYLRDAAVELVPLTVDLDSLRETMLATQQPIPSITTRFEDVRRRYARELQNSVTLQRVTNISRSEDVARLVERSAREYAATGREYEKNLHLIEESLTEVEQDLHVVVRGVVATPDENGLTLYIDRTPTTRQDTRVVVRARSPRPPATPRPEAPLPSRRMQIRVMHDGNGSVNIDMDVDSLVEKSLEAIPGFKFQWNGASEAPRPPLPPGVRFDTSIEIHRNHSFPPAPPGTREERRIIVRSPRAKPEGTWVTDSLSITDPPVRIFRPAERDGR